MSKFERSRASLAAVFLSVLSATPALAVPKTGNALIDIYNMLPQDVWTVLAVIGGVVGYRLFLHRPDCTCRCGMHCKCKCKCSATCSCVQAPAKLQR